MNNLNLIKSQAIIIWLYSTKNVKQLRKHGYIHYVSRRMKYAVMYIDKAEETQVLDDIRSYYFVRDVDISHRDEIDMEFKEPLASESLEVDSQAVEEVEDENSLIDEIAESIRLKRQNDQT